MYGVYAVLAHTTTKKLYIFIFSFDFVLVLQNFIINLQNDKHILNKTLINTVHEFIIYLII